MKNYFKIGLMALTLAFGVTSCDKDDNGGAAVNALSLEAQGLASKVTFNESVGIANPKGSESLTAKNHIAFDHIYASAPQVLSITNDDNDGALVWMGSYEAGNIGGGLTAGDNYGFPIVLPNGNYTATSSNASNTLSETVLGFLPYTSTVSFPLTTNASIALVSSLKRGFVIVNVEDADGGDRVTNATLGGADLIVDQRDGLGDRFGYLLADTYEVIIDYTLNGGAGTQEGMQTVGIGNAYTIDLLLSAELVYVARDYSVYAPAFGTQIAGFDQTRILNNPNGIFDPAILAEELSRSITVSGTVGFSSVVTSTEAIIGSDVNGDGDTDDVASRTVTADAVYTASHGLGSHTVVTPSTPWLAPGENTVDVGENGVTPPATADTTAPVITLVGPASGFVNIDYTFEVSSDDADATIAWSKNGVLQTGETGASYVVSFNNAEAGKNISVTVTDAADNSATESHDIVISVPVNGIDTWDATGTYGGEEVNVGDVTYNTAPVDPSVATYTKIGTQGYSITASGTIETYSVVDAQDGNILDGATRNVEAAAAQTGLSREVSNEPNTVNPNYDDGSSDAITGSASIVVDLGAVQNALISVGAVTLNGASVALADGSFDFSEAGDYVLRVDHIAQGNGISTATATIAIAGDNIITLTASAGVYVATVTQ